jgi:hypothetical protein
MFQQQYEAEKSWSARPFPGYQLEYSSPDDRRSKNKGQKDWPYRRIQRQLFHKKEQPSRKFYLLIYSYVDHS